MVQKWVRPKKRRQCFNRFHPISHSRLWELQILIISVPILIFSAVALGVQEKNSKLQQKLKYYEEGNTSNKEDYIKTQEKLNSYSVLKVGVLKEY